MPKTFRDKPTWFPNGIKGRYLARAVIGYYNVQDYGAKGDGITDDTVAIQSCINAATTNSTVLFPDTGSSYKTGPLLVSAQTSLRLLGGGRGGSALQFYPTGNQSDTITSGTDPGTCIQFARSSGTLLQFQCAVEDLSISTSNLTFDKNAIRVVNNSRFYMSNVTINGMWGGPSFSCALRLMGREIFQANNCYFAGSLPIRISKNPSATTISCDSHHFQDMYLIGPTISTPGALLGPAIGKPSCCVLIDNNTRVNNLTWDGTQAWVGGNDGLNWLCPTNPGDIASGVIFENIRKEQNYGASGNTLFNIDHAGNGNFLRDITFINCQTSELNTTAFKLFGIGLASMTSCGGYLYGISNGAYVAQTNGLKCMTWRNMLFPRLDLTSVATANNLVGFSGGSPFNAAFRTDGGAWALPTDAVWLA